MNEERCVDYVTVRLKFPKSVRFEVFLLVLNDQ